MSTEPIVLTVTVGCDVDAAFELWTKEITSWWPVAPHSVGGDDVADVVFESRVGGRVYEVQRDGTVCTWAEIERWEPPNGFGLAWHPGYDAEQATHVDVRFEPAAQGGTDVRLEHRGWEHLGTGAHDARTSYADGWPLVLRNYVERAPSKVS